MSEKLVGIDLRPIYEPNFLTNPDLVFEELLRLDWLEETEARQEYFMSIEPRSYTYGQGIGQRTYSSNPMIPTIGFILTGLNNKTESSYNVCFLNRYDTQKNQLGWHSDNHLGLDITHAIGVISLGAEREIWWKRKEDKGPIPANQRQLLGNGSLFVMPSGFQDLYLHRIPKCDRECGCRISLTFRRF